MKNTAIKFLTTLLLLSLALSVAQISYASEILGTLSTEADPSKTTISNSQNNNPQTLSEQVVESQNNLASLSESNVAKSFISNLLGTNNNSGTMLEGILIGILLTFFLGLLIFMIAIFIKRGRKKINNTDITL